MRKNRITTMRNYYGYFKKRNKWISHAEHSEYIPQKTKEKYSQVMLCIFKKIREAIEYMKP